MSELQKEKKDRKVFEIDLNDMNLESFKRNPIVVIDGDISRPPVGIAQHITSKTAAIVFVHQVLIDFLETIKISPVWSVDKKGKKTLLYLSARISA